MTRAIPSPSSGWKTAQTAVFPVHKAAERVLAADISGREFGDRLRHHWDSVDTDAAGVRAAEEGPVLALKLAAPHHVICLVTTSVVTAQAAHAPQVNQSLQPVAGHAGVVPAEALPAGA
mmetsp:Transcript_13343/g.37792  ORF Transcript_13343/g.37792 Transcript_13343/m.37792 type:complete len:119 (-) Transcript_13343:597-953(-)